MIKTEIIESINRALEATDKKPFDCVFMSCLLAADLLDNLKCNAKVITGDLILDGTPLFVQDFSLRGTENTGLTSEWKGHCWVLLDDRYVIDLSIGRTLDHVNLANKKIEQIKGKGAVVIDIFNNDTPLAHIQKDIMSDEFITASIQSIWNCETDEE